MKKLIACLTVLGALAAPATAQQSARPITDASIASLSGSSQQLFADAGSSAIIERYICNPSASSYIAVNLSGGTAALYTGGSVTLAPSQCWVGKVSNSINVIGTAGQGVTAGVK